MPQRCQNQSRSASGKSRMEKAGTQGSVLENDYKLYVLSVQKPMRQDAKFVNESPGRSGQQVFAGCDAAFTRPTDWRNEFHRRHHAVH